MLTRLISIGIALVLLAGCASLKQEAGYNAEETRVEQGDQGGVQPPWRCISIRGRVADIFGYTVAMIELPKPRSEIWDDAISHRSYKVGKSERAVECSVWRTAHYSNGRVKVYDAVMNPGQTWLYALLPIGMVSEQLRGHWLVWFADGKTVMTTLGRVLTVEGGAMELSDQFFADNPSPLQQHATLRRDDDDGRKFFEQLEKRFPVPLPVGDEVFSTQPNIVHVGALAKDEAVLSRLVSCGSLVAVPTVKGTAISALLSLPHNIAVAKNGCGQRKSAQEATPPGSLLRDPSRNPE